MAKYWKIPATYIAGTLGKAVGQTAGTVSTTAGKTLDKVEAKILALQRESDDLQKWIRVVQDKTEQILLEQNSKTELQSTDSPYSAFLQSNTSGTSLVGQDFNPTVNETELLNNTIATVKQKVSSFNRNSQLSIQTMKGTLDTLTRTIKAILRVTASLKAVVASLKVPIPPFKTIIRIIKLLPIPQRYLIVSFTVIESDLLEMLEQLIAQAEEEIQGIENIINSLEAILRPILERIERIRASLNILGIDCRLAGASTQDQRILNMYGIIDSNSGESLISKIQRGLVGGKNIQGYGIPEDVDLTVPFVANQLALAKEGDIIGIKEVPKGTFIETWFSPDSEIPVGFPSNTGSWTKTPDSGSELWKVDLKVTGKGTIFGGLGESASRATEDDFKAIRFEKDKSDNEEEYRVLGPHNFDQKPGILKSDNWLEVANAALEKLQNAPLSQDLKDGLVEFWNEMVTDAQKEVSNDSMVNPTKFQWRSKTGELYDLEVVNDENSPSVAVRRFIRVKDSSGTTILDGIKTFSTNIDILLEEIKLQLDQLTQ